MTSFHTTALLVNKILSRLLSRVTFVEIGPNHATIEFGHRRYCITLLENDVVVVHSLMLSKYGTIEYHLTQDSYSRWVEDVLNGKTRNDKGEMT